MKKIIKPKGLAKVWREVKRPFLQAGELLKQNLTRSRLKIERLFKELTGKGAGVTTIKRNPRIIVSLTSFPPRIPKLQYTIYSLFNQTEKPDEIVLWLGEEQFPNRNADLPESLLKLVKHGLTIKWCRDIQSYKKLIPSLKAYPNDVIVTVDDDVFYPPQMLERLLASYAKEKNAVHAHRAHVIAFRENDGIADYDDWKKAVSFKKTQPSFRNFLTSGGGTLFPPKILHNDICREDLFMKIAPTADDIWFWAMAVLNDVKIQVVKNNIAEINENISNSRQNNNLRHLNVSQGHNDRQIQNLIDYYPTIKAKLIEERYVQSSSSYWNDRYQGGGNSGAGSYGKFAEWKAEVLNAFVRKNDIQSVIELGCGDGNQLSLSSYPQYTGFDVSEKAIEICRLHFNGDETKSFKLMSDYSSEKADLSLSLDVIYHLVEDIVFENYIQTLFASSHHFVVIYSSNDEKLNAVTAPHVRHRNFTDWVDKNLPEWKLIQHMPNKYPYLGNHLKGSFADFFFYQKASYQQ